MEELLGARTAEQSSESRERITKLMLEDSSDAVRAPESEVRFSEREPSSSGMEFARRTDGFSGYGCCGGGGATAVEATTVEATMMDTSEGMGRTTGKGGQG